MHVYMCAYVYVYVYTLKCICKHLKNSEATDGIFDMDGQMDKEMSTTRTKGDYKGTSITESTENG